VYVITAFSAILKGLNHLAQGCPESSRGYPGSNPIKTINAEGVASQLFALQKTAFKSVTKVVTM
jgi:hypothetical protein